MWDRLGHPPRGKRQQTDHHADTDDRVQPLLVVHLLNPSAEVGAANGTTGHRPKHDKTIKPFGVPKVDRVVKE